MKKAKLSFLVAGILVLAFSLFCLYDWLRIHETDSAPYWAWVSARAIELLIPAAIFFLAGLYFMFRNKKTGSPSSKKQQ